MAILSISCIFVLVACVIVSTPFIQGRNLRRRHGHHSHTDYYNLEESLPRNLLGRLEDDLEYNRDFYGQTKKREYPAKVLDRSSEYYEDSEDEVSPFLPRYKHEYSSRDRESLQRKEDSLRKHDFDAFSRIVARRKRHNKHGSSVRYQDNRDLYQNDFYEMEVKVAQNRSICNYTVESIPDLSGSRIPRDLEHVKCNHLGSSCQGIDTYCCIQTYRNIQVSYGNGPNETMKLYVGCVCASQGAHHFINLQSRPKNIND